MSETAGFEIGKDGAGTVIVGYDGTPPATHAAAWAAGLARREQAKLVLVYVEALSSPAYWSAVGVAAAADAANEVAIELRDEIAARLEGTGIDWEMLHGKGDPAGVLEEIAGERRADCIVIGRARHRGGLLGSVPKALVTKSERPVVVVP
jgi:nucleotide-binding universal stress UspA family protein